MLEILFGSFVDLFDWVRGIVLEEPDEVLDLPLGVRDWVGFVLAREEHHRGVTFDGIAFDFVYCGVDLGYAQSLILPQHIG